MAMATPSPSSGQGSGDAMDAALWGELHRYIDLTCIFAKLPLHHFFRLRQVCKEWNRLASNPKFLHNTFTTPIPKPYFVVDSHRTGHRLLAHDAGAWTWTRLPRVKCEAEGLIFCEDSDSNRVFDVHTRVFHVLPEVRLPPLPVEEEEDEEEDYAEPLVGMIVDTSVSPFTFQVIVGDDIIGTQIYNSTTGSWTQKMSVNEEAAIGRGAWSRPTSVYCDGILYIRVFRTWGFGNIDLHSYDLQRDDWNCELLNWVAEAEWVFCDIGVWRDRLFMIGMKFESLDCGIMVWELHKQYSVYGYGSDEDWMVFDLMPEDLYSWVVAGAEEKLPYDLGLLNHWVEVVDIRSRFCGEYVLVYNAVGVEDVTERAVLYNLESMKWEKLELPGPGV
jgi:hypothetical protein